MCPGWWGSAQDPWTWVFVEGCDWADYKNTQREQRARSEGEGPLRVDFKICFTEAAWPPTRALTNWHPGESHKKGLPQAAGRLGVSYKDICARERYPCPTLTSCPGAPAHENTCQMDLLWLFRAWGLSREGKLFYSKFTLRTSLVSVKSFQIIQFHCYHRVGNFLIDLSQNGKQWKRYISHAYFLP